MGVREKGNDLHIKLEVFVSRISTIRCQYNGNDKRGIKFYILSVTRHFLVPTKS